MAVRHKMTANTNDTLVQYVCLSALPTESPNTAESLSPLTGKKLFLHLCLHIFRFQAENEIYPQRELCQKQFAMAVDGLFFPVIIRISISKYRKKMSGAQMVVLVKMSLFV